MQATDIAPASLVGQTFDCAFGQFVPRLTVRSTTELRVQALIGDVEVDEIVKAALTGVRPNLVMMSWTEQSGTFVVQLQDHENGIVHNCDRLPDGQIFNAQGTLTPVAAA